MQPDRQTTDTRSAVKKKVETPAMIAKTMGTAIPATISPTTEEMTVPIAAVNIRLR